MVHRDVIRRTICCGCLALAVLAGGCRPSREPLDPAAPPDKPLQVDLLVDFGPDAERQRWELQVPPGSTVLDCLRVAQRDRGLEFSVRGEGSSAFLLSLGGVPNGGGAADNWIFRVDGQLGTASCGVVPVHSGARIEWSRGAYQPE